MEPIKTKPFPIKRMNVASLARILFIRRIPGSAGKNKLIDQIDRWDVPPPLARCSTAVDWLTDSWTDAFL